MGSISTAFRAFFGALFNGKTASRVDLALRGTEPPRPPTIEVVPPKPAEQPKPIEPKSRQSEAVTLLATLQREARLIDFLKEDLSQYSDEQIGAAVREIHRDSGSVLNRLFAIKPILEQQEGEPVSVPAGFDAARYRLSGHVTGAAPFQGTLRHHGWEVTRCELPAFTGSDSAAKTIAPAEVEVMK